MICLAVVISYLVDQKHIEIFSTKERNFRSNTEIKSVEKKRSTAAMAHYRSESWTPVFSGTIDEILA